MISPTTDPKDGWWRSYAGRIGARIAHARHGTVAMTTKAHEVARQKLDAQLLAEADIDPNSLTPEELAKRVRLLRAAHFQRLAYRSARARRQGAARREAAS